jgi:uncharacterized protein YciI
MIVATVTYRAETAKIDAMRPAHLEWLKQGMAEGRLLAAGRQVPMVGGILLARGSRDAIEAWCATDPYVAHDLADYSFAEFLPGMFAPGLESLGQ